MDQAHGVVILYRGFVPVDPMDDRPFFEQVADELEKRIKAGKIKKGDQLPSEADLEDEFGVARGTIRRAMEELRGRGLVKTFRARGSYVV